MASDPSTNARAALDQVNAVTLPKIYREIGRRVAKSPKPPSVLKHHFDAIARLKPAADAKNPAAVAELRQVYAALGREAVEKYGDRAVPRDVSPYLQAALAQQKSAAAALQRETAPPRAPTVLDHDEVAAPLHLPVFPQLKPAVRSRRRRAERGYLVVGSLLLMVAGGVAVAVAVPSIRRSVTDVVIAGTQGAVRSGAPQHTAARAGGRETPAYAGAIDRAVIKTLGPIAGDYPDYGLAGVDLGQTYEQVTAKTELPRVDGMYPFKFLSAEGSQYFVFDTDRRLRVYGKKYDGGPAENAEVIRRVFGRTGNQMINRVFKTSQSRTDSQMFVYSFPKVIAFVEFRTMRFVYYGQIEERQETFLYVLDRQWALPMLHKSAAAKRPLIEWMKLAADRVATGKCDDAEKYTPKGVTLSPDDEEKPCRRWSLIEPGNEEQARVGWVRTVSPEYLKHVHMKPGSVGVEVYFGDLAALQGEVFLLDDREEGGFDAIRHAPVLGVLDVEVTLRLMLEHFSPEDGKYNYVPDERGGVTVGSGYYEWTHVSSKNAIYDVVWNTTGGAGAFFITGPSP